MEKFSGLLRHGLFEKKFMDSKVTTRTVTKREEILGHLIGPLGLIFVVNTIAALVEKFFTQQCGVMYGAGNIEMIKLMGGRYEIIMTVAKILAVGIGLLNGFLIQKTQSKQGRMRPWHLIFGFASIAIGFLIFLFPGNTMGESYWFYFFALVICYHTIGSTYFYLFRDTIVSITTRDPKEKAKLKFIRQLAWTLISGIIIGMVINMVVLPMWLDQDINGYPVLMIALSVVAIPLLLLEYFYTKERIIEDVAQEVGIEKENNIPLKQQLRALFTNKYFVILTILATIGGIVDNFKGGNVQYFYIKFLLGGEANYGMYTIYQVVTGIPLGVGLFAVWPLAKRFGIKNVAWILNPLYTFVQSKLFRRSVAEIKKNRPSMNGCAYVELQDDMFTAVDEPKLVLDSLTTAPKDTLLYDHPFYEAASIRKFGDLYYLVYSSGRNNELAYATSAYPDKDFKYRGVIISNADLGLLDNTIPKAPAGTIHGGIEKINGQYYVFYHRCTHGTDFSRQACAESIEILPDGTIKQVEITSCGLNGKPLIGKGTYPAAICCNLYTGKKMPLNRKSRMRIPQIIETDGTQIITNIVNGTTVGYKYFDLSANSYLAVKIHGTASGIFEVRGEENGVVLGCVPIEPSERWREFGVKLTNKAGKSALFLTFRGIGKLELQEISMGAYFHENRD